jgi:ribosomal 50S subunit-recycling heat shock protein
MRFDVVLAELHLYKSRSQARAAIEDGQALLNGGEVKPSHTVKIGDRITLRASQGERTAELLDLPRRSLSKAAARELLRDC